MVGVWVAFSRILGLVRESLYAACFGAGAYFDAFATAYKLPNMLRDLLGEGALSTAVVARLGKVEVSEGRERVATVIRRLTAFALCAMFGVSLLGILLAPWLVGALMAPGWSDRPEQVERTVQLTRMIFPYLGLVGMAALTMGVLHHLRRFGWASAASSFFNGTVILITGVGIWLAGVSGEDALKLAALAIVIGGVAQWFGQWPGLRGSGLRLWPDFHFRDPEIRRVLQLIAPAILGVAAVQINVAVNHAYASFLEEGSVSAIYFAFRLMHLPVGVVGVAVATVLLPRLTERHARADEAGFQSGLRASLTQVASLSLPAMAGLYALDVDFVALIYERREFDTSDTSRTWLALSGYIPGILAIAFNKNLTQAFYARGDVRSPVLVSLASVAVNATLNYLLVFEWKFGLQGLCAGTSAVLYANSLFLAWLLYRKHRIVWLGKRELLQVLGMLALAVGMYGLLRGLSNWLGDIPTALRVFILLGAGAASYLASLRFFKFQHTDRVPQ